MKISTSQLSPKMWPDSSISLVPELVDRAPSRHSTESQAMMPPMEQVLGASEKVLVENGAGGSGVVPYLPLPELRSRTTTTTGAGE